MDQEAISLQKAKIFNMSPYILLHFNDEQVLKILLNGPNHVVIFTYSDFFLHHEDRINCEFLSGHGALMSSLCINLVGRFMFKSGLRKRMLRTGLLCVPLTL